MPEPAIVVQKAYDLTLWILPKAQRLPQNYRHTLGQHLVTTALDLLASLVDAMYETSKPAPLAEAVRHVNRLRYLIRLAKDLKLLTLDSHEFAARALDEIGRMAGGWRKAVKS